MENILDRIISNTKETVQSRKSIVPLANLKEKIAQATEVKSLSKSIRNGSGIIAEFKRRSPSKGAINADAAVENIVPWYELAGASAVSILTDQWFFGGSLNDLEKASQVIQLPILRKDFIVDVYQLYEARAYGADAVLLIAAALTDEQLDYLANEALQLDLEILFEVHDRTELERITQLSNQLNPTKICVGVNNRNLKTFITNIQVSKELSNYMPENITLISESGISDPATVRELKELGFHGFLIGESFMITADPGAACRDFIEQL
jgi:indole-3-glycerol phosphate synthase